MYRSIILFEKTVHLRELASVHKWGRNFKSKNFGRSADIAINFKFSMASNGEFCNLKTASFLKRLKSRELYLLRLIKNVSRGFFYSSF